MKYVTVKIKKSRRIGIRIFAACLFLLAALFCIFNDDPILKLLVLSVTAVPPGLLLWHMESWSVTFGREHLTRRRCFIIRRYKWNDVQDVTASRSATDGETIRIRFRDGRVFQFRREDENAAAAVKLILSHCSIRSK